MLFNLLLEKISRGISVFDRNFAHKDLGPEKYSQLTVVFEFECYLDLGDLSQYNNDTQNNADWQYLSYYDTSYSKWAGVLNDYFKLSYSTADQIENDFEDWKEEKINEEIERLKEKYTNEQIEEILLDDENFFSDTAYDNISHLSPVSFYKDVWNENFIGMINHYRIEPKFGWSPHRDDSFYTEELEINDDNGDNDTIDFNAHREDFYYIIKDDLDNYFSEPIDVSSGYHAHHKNKKHWTIEYDSSLDDEEKGKVSTEIVSPWIPGDQAMDYLKKFKDFFDDMKGLTTKSTGCHMNIRYGDTSFKEIDWVKLLFLSQDERELRKFERQFGFHHYEHLSDDELREKQRTNKKFDYIKQDNGQVAVYDKTDRHEYAKPVMDSLRQIKRQLDEDMPITNLDILKTFIKDHYKLNKYQSINLHKFEDDKDFVKDPQGREIVQKTGRQGFVEFRIPGDDYLNIKFAKTELALIKFMNLMLVTSDADMFKSEYHLRLQRFLENVIRKDTKRLGAQPLFNSTLPWFKRVVQFLNPRYNLAKTISELKHYITHDTTENELLKSNIIRPRHMTEDDLISNHIEHAFVKSRANNVWMWLLFHKLIKLRNHPNFNTYKNHISDLLLSYLKSNIITKSELRRLINSYLTMFDLDANKEVESMLYSIPEQYQNDTPEKDALLNRGDIGQGGMYIGEFNNYGIIVSKNLFMEKAWKLDSNESKGAMSTSDGHQNTLDIKNENDIYEHPCFNEIIGKNIDGYTDWYIPSSDEMEFVSNSAYLLNKDSIFALDMDELYWTSTQVKSDSRYAYAVEEGESFSQNKTYRLRFRPIRKIKQ
jgi:hypothetical protein